MFTPERTALLVLAASLLIFAAVVMCSRSSLGEPIPMVADSVAVVTRTDTAPTQRESANSPDKLTKKPRPTSQRNRQSQKHNPPPRDHWNEPIPQQ